MRGGQSRRPIATIERAKSTKTKGVKMTEDSNRNITTVKSVEALGGRVEIQSASGSDDMRLGLQPARGTASEILLDTTHALDLALALAEQALRKTPGHPLAPSVRCLLLDLRASQNDPSG